VSNEYTCSICSGKFDLEKEGGTAGDIGILEVAFCPTCYAGIFDMVQQACLRCIEAEEEENES